MITAGTGKHRVQLEKLRIGAHLIYILQGGEKPHIGAIVLCEPEKEAKIICLGTHKDYILLQPLAETACKKFKTTVVAIGGVHIDNASKKDIEIMIKNSKELELCI